MNKNYGWMCTLEELYQINENDVLTQLTEFLKDYDFPVEESHLASWRDTLVCQH